MTFLEKQKEINEIFDDLIKEIELQRASALWFNQTIRINIVKKQKEDYQLIVYRVEHRSE